MSDGARVLADVDTAGDEPLMLARALPGVPVLVGADRYLSGRLAERQLGATVHLLDDGFQHLQLARDVDLLLVSEDDLHDRAAAGRPAARAARRGRGRRRGARRRPATTPRPSGSAARSACRPCSASTRALGAPRHDRGARDTGGRAAGRSRVFAVAGIARPERFFADLRVGRLARSPARCVSAIITGSRSATSTRIAAAARAAGAAIVLTTEKDAVRLTACDLGDLPIAAVPLRRRHRAGRRVSPTGCSIALSRARAAGAPRVEPTIEPMKHRLEYADRAALIARRARHARRARARVRARLLGLAFYTLDRAHRRIAERNLARGVSRAAGGRAARDRRAARSRTSAGCCSSC